MTATAATKTAEPVAEAPPPADPAPRRPPEVDPALVWPNYRGHAFAEHFVRLPAGFVLDDLKEPGLWRRVQGSPKAFNKLDRVVMVTDDEGQMFTCHVAAATPAAASLSKPTILEMVSRTPSQYADENYKIEWRNGSHAIIRKRDGHVMATGFGSEGAAITALNQLYPRRV